jgi:hypothetical protein
MKLNSLFGIAIFVVGTSAAEAETVDMAKLTCAEMTKSYVDEIIVTGAWLSGYFNAKNSNTVVDLKQLTLNSRNVITFCGSNPTVTVMDAVQKVAKPN